MIQTCGKYEPMKFDPKVLEVQVKLNTIRSLNHIYLSGWDHLVQDGKYGPASKRAVIAFKTYYRLTDRSDKLDSSAISNINMKYSAATTLRYCVLTAPEPTNIVSKAVEVSSSYGFMDFVDDILSAISDTTNKMAEMIQTVNDPKLLSDKNTANAFIKKFSAISESYDDSLGKLKKSVRKIWQDKEVLDSLSTEAKKQVHTARRNMEARQIQMSQQKSSNVGRMIKIEKANIRQMQSAITHKTAEINIVNKIKVKFKPKTVVATAKYVKPIAFVYSARDLVVDIVWESWHMDSEAFKQKFKQDLYKFVDDLILGHLAEWIVIAILHAVGITVISGGVIVVAILGCILVSSIIGYLLDEKNIKFSEYYEEGIQTIANCIYQLG